MSSTYLVPRLEKTQGRKRLLDLGCGDGSLLECLLRITDFEQLYGYDIAAICCATSIRAFTPPCSTFPGLGRCRKSMPSSSAPA